MGVFGGYAILGLALGCIHVHPPAVVRLGATLCFAAGTFACCWGLVSLLGRTAVNAPNIPPVALDERQLARRGEALSRTQPAFGFALTVCAGYALLEWVEPHLRAPGLMVYLTFGLLLLGVVLPTTYLAWTEADAPRDA